MARTILGSFLEDLKKFAAKQASRCAAIKIKRKKQRKPKIETRIKQMPNKSKIIPYSKKIRNMRIKD